MTLRARLETAAVVVAMILAAGGGAAAGVRAGRAASAPAVERVTVAAPGSLSGPVADAARSAGGFTGFGGAPAVRGEVQRSGPVLSIEADSLVVGTPGSSVTVRYTSSQRFFRIVPAARPVQVGDLVQVRVEGGRAVAVLRLPLGLEEGGNLGR